MSAWIIIGERKGAKREIKKVTASDGTGVTHEDDRYFRTGHGEGVFEKRTQRVRV
jgi:hypothetical protein